MHELIGLRVALPACSERGTIAEIDGSILTVQTHSQLYQFPFPSAIGTTVRLEDQQLEVKYRSVAAESGFEEFRALFQNAVLSEINYLRVNGGKRYRAIEGKRVKTNGRSFTYLFETDQELHFPDDTALKLFLPERKLIGYAVSCEGYNIIIRTTEPMGDVVPYVEFTADQWHLLEALFERLSELDAGYGSIPYQLACCGRSQIEKMKQIELGQACAMTKVQQQPITFIWGPPGTGKTKTLTDIAAEFLHDGKRVLMLSYSNVSVDGAMLKLADKVSRRNGYIIRYGYPRDEQLVNDDELTSYNYILKKFPKDYQRYRTLLDKKRRLKQDNPDYVKVVNEIARIRSDLRGYEKKLVRESAFVATTVSKAIADEAIYGQKFDLVLFDEASMAYVPQIVFAAGLAKSRFCCLGDFQQLPAIVQNSSDKVLSRDIFDFCGITDAVEHDIGHRWLVLLNVQYRMHPAIAELSSQFMYKNAVKTASVITQHRQQLADCSPMKGSPMLLLDLSGTYSVCTKTMDGSHVNLLSAMISMKLAEIMADQYEVGIIAPYSAQARLVLAMIRDLRERDSLKNAASELSDNMLQVPEVSKYEKVSSATVHQFQGSEKPFIIYDAVDCYRVPYPGMLLTSLKNNQANRLFNVAMTRAQGKFIVVANCDYLHRKHLSEKLLFAKTLKKLEKQEQVLQGEAIIDEIGSYEGEEPDVFLGLTDELDSWERFCVDVTAAAKSIQIDIPGIVDHDEKAFKELSELLHAAVERGVEITVRAEAPDIVPACLKQYLSISGYVTTPVTIIDRKVIWYGQPLSAAEFITEGTVLKTEMYPCLRFFGEKTARLLNTMLS